VALLILERPQRYRLVKRPATFTARLTNGLPTGIFSVAMIFLCSHEAKFATHYLPLCRNIGILPFRSTEMVTERDPDRKEYNWRLKKSMFGRHFQLATRSSDKNDLCNVGSADLHFQYVSVTWFRVLKTEEDLLKSLPSKDIHHRELALDWR